MYSSTIYYTMIVYISPGDLAGSNLMCVQTSQRFGRLRSMPSPSMITENRERKPELTCYRS